MSVKVINNLQTKVDPFDGRKQLVIPSLTTNDAQKAIEFYKNVFDARIRYMAKKYIPKYGDEKVVHAEIEIGNISFMIGDENIFTDPSGSNDMKSAKTIGDTPVTFYVYTEDADKLVEKATQFGARIIYPIQNEFYGDRVGTVIDPFGFKWSIATHIKNPNEREINEGFDKMLTNHSNSNGYYEKYMKYKKKYISEKNK